MPVFSLGPISKMRSTVTVSLAVLAWFFSGIQSQDVPVASIQTTGFNSSFSLAQDQIELAQLSESVARSTENIINYDRSQLAFGGPHEDDFYTLPPLTNHTGPLEPGLPLKVQAFIDPASFAIPPDTALSRILYTTTNLNGTVIPASAFILWPYNPLQFHAIPTHSNGTASAPVVLWEHGTSGFFPNAAPSAHRALWYGYSAPFALALEGYAVVAADYAGLGISKSWDGSDIPHQYLASPAAAGDSLYALQAAWEAFPEKLTGEFVAMGHSQGGGVAWSIAELLASAPGKFRDQLHGYKGTIAGSPTTGVFAGYPEFILPWVGMALRSIFPDFRLESWLTPLGIAKTKVFREIEGGMSVAQQFYLSGDEVAKADYNETWYVDAYSKLANAGNKETEGPILVIQGTEDTYVGYEGTERTVNSTCDLFPDTDLEFLVLPEVGHVPALSASQSVWLQWIADRFDQKPVRQRGCHRRELASFLPVAQYQTAGNSFPQWAGASEFSYQVPLGP